MEKRGRQIHEKGFTMKVIQRFTILLILALCIATAVAQGTMPPLSHLQQAPVEGITTAGDKPIVSINLVSYDPIIGDVAGRVTVIWPQSMLSKDYGLYHDARLLEGYSIEDSILDIKGNKPFVIFNSSLKTLNEVDGSGSQFLYPFDTHHIRMRIGLVTNLGNGWQPLPFDVDCTKCTFEGFLITFDGQVDAQGYYNVKFTIRRTFPTMVFAIILNVVMVLIAVIVLVMAVRILRQNEVPQITSLGFIGGLLFAIPAVRNLQPKIPSMGLMIDYAGFFWAEGFLVIALLIVMICWLMREKPKED
ncbi:DUF4436 domain-containing protein [Dyella sp. M7H15-1]|uniref:DUF4436 family protein n=1 Tax=Dyella sp. M7H15-1 TaxID=2501295 RepID=UPI0010050B07|nr:DUF4436 family protein [Dyella sp. M7H15-1]QAU24882.1 DUF4436 domain-containing protein [Dyella sp. M7H15-1]